MNKNFRQVNHSNFPRRVVQIDNFSLSLQFEQIFSTSYQQLINNIIIIFD